MNHISGAPEIMKSFLLYTETIAGKSRKTVEEYYFDLRIFFRFVLRSRGLADKSLEFDKIPIDSVDLDLVKSITLTDIYEFLNFSKTESNNQNRAIARKIATLRSYFKYFSAKVMLITDNPTKNLDTPKARKSLPVHLSMDESVTLLNSVSGSNEARDYAILTLFLNCGLRVSELTAINLRHYSGDTIRVLGKGNKERTVYLNDACIDAIDRYLKVRPAEAVKDRDALFLSSRKQRISVKTVQWLVKKYIKEAGLDPDRYSAHKLRHTAATLMYKYGNVDIRALQAILGHEQLSTTEIYTHIDDDQLRLAAKQNPLANLKK